MNDYDPKRHTWYIFRHGLATHSAEGYGDEILTAGILPESEPDIERMGAFLADIPDSTNVTSGLPRCRQTADILTRITGKRFSADDRLTEFYRETFAQFRGRIEQFLSDMKGVQTQDILVCTHGSVLAGIRHFITEGEFRESELYDYTECGELLIIRNGQTHIRDFRGGDTRL